VSFPEAALGSTVTVPTLEDQVTLRVPPGTSPGTVLRVRGRGVPARKREERGQGGDLLVKVDVEVPKTLTDEERAAVEALADASASASSGPRVEKENQEVGD